MHEFISVLVIYCCVKKLPQRKWHPILVFLPGKFHGQRSLVAYNPWGCKESDTTERWTQQWFKRTTFTGTPLGVQWLRVPLPIQGTRVRLLVWEDSTCHRATEPMHHDYWDWMLQLPKPMPIELTLRSRRSLHTARRNQPCSLQVEKACAQQRRPSTAKINKLQKQTKKHLLSHLIVSAGEESGHSLGLSQAATEILAGAAVIWRLQLRGSRLPCSLTWWLGGFSFLWATEQSLSSSLTIG